MERPDVYMKETARRLKTESLALYLALRHPGTPWYAKLAAAAVVAYAFSPVDLIPDFIPVLGYVDDLILIPAGIALAVRLVPGPVMAACRDRARIVSDGKMPVSRAAGVVVVLLWIAAAAGCGMLVRRMFF